MVIIFKSSSKVLVCNLFHCLSPVYTFTIFSTIHHDSPRFLMVRKIGVDRDESWRKVEIFSVTTNVYDTSTVPVRYRYESMTIRDGNASVNED